MNPSLPRGAPPRRGGDRHHRRRRAASRAQSARTLKLLIALVIGGATFLIALMAARAADARQRTPEERARDEKATATPVTTPGAPFPIAVTVRTLRDGGGLPAPVKGDAALNVRLTQALTKFLRDSVPARAFEVLTPGAKSQTAVMRRFTLEGELTGADTGDGGGYLCYLRLYDEGDKARRSRPRRLIGQWAGTADSLRYLTGNLGRDNRVSPMGLMGEMGGRVGTVLTTVARDPEIALDALAAQTGRKPPFDARLAVTPAPVPPQNGPDGLPIGLTYQAQLTAREAGEACLVQIPIGGDASELPPRFPMGAETPLWFAAGAFSLPATAASNPFAGSVEVIVLFHRAAAKPVAIATTPPPTPAAALLPDKDDASDANEDLTGVTGLGGGSWGSPALDLSRTSDDEPPVRVVGVVIRLRDPARTDPALAALLARIAADPPGAWFAVRLRER